MAYPADWQVYATSINHTVLSTNIGIPERIPRNYPVQDNDSSVTAGTPPLVGTGTMHVRNIINGLGVHFIPKYPGFLATDRGLVSGKIRWIQHVESIGGVTQFGASCLQSALDMVNATGNGYVCVFDNFTFSNRIRIGKVTSALLKNYSSLASTPSLVWTTGVSYAMEFIWDASSGTQVDLTVNRGTMLDFSDLTPLLFVTDSTSPHITSVAEGLWHHGISGGADLFWDSTTIYKQI